MGIADDVATFRRQGYCVLDTPLTRGELSSLRDAADQLLGEPTEVDLRYHDIERGDDRRFLRLRHEDLPPVSEFLFGDRMRHLARAFTGGDAYLFVEQFVVKGPRTGAGFAWHQDSGYVGFAHEPYVSFWIALDDVTEENGCISILPRNIDRNRRIEEHVWDEYNKEKVGYRGPDPGTAIPCPAGTIVVFSSLTLHRSGPNTTDRPRRAYLCQYSPEPIIDPATGAPKHFAKLIPA